LGVVIKVVVVVRFINRKRRDDRNAGGNPGGLGKRR
jgi:hypothetical protein